ncbi:MAG: efflux RND transporter periplasmic adaptor subunit, partial [Gemmataceae bacterium]|nr:efflux RND transporter periplasmic adaptor subunit [Gemmataceae bacterium]
RSALLTAVLGPFLLLAVGCGPSDSAKPPPVQVSAPNEQNLAVVTLSEDSYRQLDIAAGLAKVRQNQRPAVRTLGGEVMVPPGRGARVTAPLAGTVAAPTGGMPKPGQKVTQGTPIFQFAPLLTAEAKVNLVTVTLEAQEQIKSARIQLQLAEAALERTRKLAADKTVSERVLEEAVVARDLAKQAADTAIVRQQLLDAILADVRGTKDTAGKETTIALKAPIDGVLQRQAVAPGATVAAGIELFEVVQTDPLWVRVPVYAGATDELKAGVAAKVRPLGARAEDAVDAPPVTDPPPIADALATSIDLYYRIDNRAGALRPGQKVSVMLELRGPAPGQSLVVPWSAVVHDIHGGTWVYENVGERAFRRRRVEVQYVEEDQDREEAVLASGPPVGTLVATGGAIELLGAEFGFGAQAK